MRISGLKHNTAGLMIPLMGILVGVFFGNIVSMNGAGAAQLKGELTATLGRNNAQIGDIVLLTLHYRLPEGGTLPESPAIGGIGGITKLDQTVAPGQIRIRLFVDRLESWQSDHLTLSFKDKAGNIQTLKADPVSITVHSVLGEKPAEAELRPIRDIILTKSLWRSYGPWIAGLLGLILILSCVYLWFRKRNRQNVSIDLMDPPHVSARKALEALNKSRIFEKGDAKSFYFSLSEIMRRYLESIRHFPAAEYTTEEITQQIRLEVDRKLVPLLRQADLVKFADTIPTPARKEEDIRSALSYIDQTHPPSTDTADAKARSRIDGGNP